MLQRKALSVAGWVSEVSREDVAAKSGRQRSERPVSRASACCRARQRRPSSVSGPALTRLRYACLQTASCRGLPGALCGVCGDCLQRTCTLLYSVWSIVMLAEDTLRRTPLTKFEIGVSALRRTVVHSLHKCQLGVAPAATACCGRECGMCR